MALRGTKIAWTTGIWLELLHTIHRAREKGGETGLEKSVNLVWGASGDVVVCPNNSEKKRGWKLILTDDRDRRREVETATWRIISRHGGRKDGTQTAEEVWVCLVWDGSAADRWRREKGKQEMWELPVGTGQWGLYRREGVQRGPNKEPGERLLVWLP